MVDWSMGVVDPLRSQAQGYDYVNKLYDTQAKRTAGRAAASGDYQGAATALGERGDVEGALKLRTFGDTQKNAEADQKVKMLKARGDYTKQAVPILKQMLTSGGPQAAIQAFEQVATALQQLGATPEEVAQYKKAFAANPQAVIQALEGAPDIEYRSLGDDIVGINKATGQVVNTIKGTPKAAAPPSQADMARDANNPFKSDGTPNEAFQRYEQQKAINNRQAIVNNPLPQGAAGGKPMPVGVQRQEDADIEIIGVANSIENDLAQFQTMVEGGQLNLGPVQNITSGARNTLGMSDENSRNYASFRATIERLRNDSLRLNKGVQTEGDATRAWNELMRNITDEKLVAQRLAEIRGINSRAAQLRQQQIDIRRQRNRAEPFDWTGFQVPQSPYGAAAPQAGPQGGGGVEEWVRGPNGKLQRK